MGEETDGDLASRTADFVYQFRCKNNNYRLKVPLDLPFEGDARELAVRLVGAHRIPCHLEDDLCQKLRRFASSASVEMLDELAERNLYGGSVFEKGSETDVTINKWTRAFADNCAQFSSATKPSSPSSDAGFSEVYHKLIHSPALETLLQLEHTYAMAVDEVIKAWDNARDIMQKKHDPDFTAAMQALESGGSEHDLNRLMRKQTLEREACEERWSNELNQLQESQRREYRDWVTKVHEDMESPDHRENSSSLLTPPKHRSVERSSSPTSSDDLIHSVKEPPPLEESFTINLGSQKKSMHNVRIMRGDPLSFCQHKRGGMGEVGAIPNPERLQTAMSLYSNKLSALVMMVDGRINSLVGIKEAFASICHQSTDFHFPDIDLQLKAIREKAVDVNMERKDCDFSASFASTSSGSPLSQDMNSSSPRPLATPTSSNGGEDTSNGAGLAAGTGVWSGKDGGANLEPGDFYLTRHSNLSQVHAVFHLVTDESVIMSSSLKTRHAIITGLKNCLRAATRHDIIHITIPLLLVHTMQPEMTINWCLRRAEMVFKCVKGFMLETTAWTESDSRTIQFLVPTGIVEGVFEELCEMLPKIFRVTSSRNLTSKRRTYSYK